MSNHSAFATNLCVVKDLQPSLLWRWFAQIASIAHPSHHEEALATFIVEWAQRQNLNVWRDSVGNVIIKKPASVGMETRTPIALQAHLDMVPQANAGIVHDFTKDPLTLRKSPDSKWLLATDTTLGADNGIGLASILALLESDLPHPELEALLTMTEETGMVGALGLQAGTLSAPIMINTDTEEIGDVYVGCAGGVDADVLLPLKYMQNTYNNAISITISGLQGGHSGLDIDKNRSSAIKLMARLLSTLRSVCDEFLLVDITGGTLRNAIARESTALIVCNAHHQPQILSAIQKAANDILGNIAISEPKARIHHLPTQATCHQAPDKTSSAKMIDLLNALPNGVMRHSDVMTDTVETSLSLGMVCIKNGQLQATLLVRSLTDMGKQTICDTIRSVANLAGASVHFSGDYVGWNIDPQSKITPIVCELYANILGKAPAVKVIHAGLECGLIKKHYPDMDIVSIGPTINNAHSPDECVDIDSVGIYWQVLTDIVANSPTRTD